jgi:DNA uptake protein ComE-like DNA-binding protein
MRTIHRNLGIALAALAIALFAAPRAEAAAKKVNLNSATAAELEALPGVGEATAKKIIAGRPYTSVADLSRAGVSSATIDKISSLVTVKGGSKTAKSETTEKKSKSEHTAAKSSATETRSEKQSASRSSSAPSSSAPVDLNTASAKDLEALPGVGEATAKKIIAGRPYSSVEDLSRAGVSASTIQKISPLVVAGGHRRASSNRAPAPASASAPPPPATGPSTSRATGGSSSSGSEVEQPYQAPPHAGMVWVNTATGVYHSEGDRWYGRTKEGKYMSEKDALAAGYRASKQKGEGEKQ